MRMYSLTWPAFVEQFAICRARALCLCKRIDDRWQSRFIHCIMFMLAEQIRISIVLAFYRSYCTVTSAVVGKYLHLPGFPSRLHTASLLCCRLTALPRWAKILPTDAVAITVNVSCIFPRIFRKETYQHGCRWPVAADGPGDRFIMGESQAGQQVSYLYSIGIVPVPKYYNLVPLVCSSSTRYQPCSEHNYWHFCVYKSRCLHKALWVTPLKWICWQVCLCDLVDTLSSRHITGVMARRTDEPIVAKHETLTRQTEGASPGES